MKGLVFKFFMSCFLLMLFLVACSESPTLSDPELFKKLYSEIREKTSNFDKTAKPFFDAVERKDMITAIQIAKNIEYPLSQMWLEINNIKTPKFQDKKLKEEVQRAVEDISSAYMYKYETVKKFLELAENPSKLLLKTAEIKDAVDKSLIFLIRGTAKLEEINHRLSKGNK